MRKPKPRLKGYADQAIVILEKQKDNKIFYKIRKSRLIRKIFIGGHEYRKVWQKSTKIQK